jgi:predicted amidohydrolase YtcJ
MGSGTALMIEPYEGQPDNLGIAVTPGEAVGEMIGKCDAAGFSLAVHAIGDRAVHDVLDAFAGAGRTVSASAERTMPHRIEHVQLVHLSDAPRLRRCGIAASMQPVHLLMDRQVADRVWGARARNAYALRSLIDQGTLMAFGSDAPVAPLNPMLGIYAAVTRQDEDGEPAGGWYPEERIGVAEAIRGYTLGPACVAGKEQVSGSITPGKWADLVVLTDNLFEITPAAIREVGVHLTVFDGKVVYGDQ